MSLRLLRCETRHQGVSPGRESVPGVGGGPAEPGRALGLGPVDYTLESTLTSLRGPTPGCGLRSDPSRPSGPARLYPRQPLSSRDRVDDEGVQGRVVSPRGVRSLVTDWGPVGTPSLELQEEGRDRDTPVLGCASSATDLCPPVPPCPSCLRRFRWSGRDSSTALGHRCDHRSQVESSQTGRSRDPDLFGGCVYVGLPAYPPVCPSAPTWGQPLSRTLPRRPGCHCASPYAGTRGPESGAWTRRGRVGLTDRDHRRPFVPRTRTGGWNPTGGTESRSQRGDTLQTRTSGKERRVPTLARPPSTNLLLARDSLRSRHNRIKTKIPPLARTGLCRPSYPERRQ